MGIFIRLYYRVTIHHLAFFPYELFVTQLFLFLKESTPLLFITNPMNCRPAKTPLKVVSSETFYIYCVQESTNILKGFQASEIERYLHAARVDQILSDFLLKKSNQYNIRNSV